MSRTANRIDYELPVRMRLAEEDLDRQEQDHEELVTALNGIRRVLMGMLVSVTTASILLAINAFLLRST